MEGIVNDKGASCVICGKFTLWKNIISTDDGDYCNNCINDCFNCNNSGVDEDDKLWCSLHQKTVEDNEKCEDWN